MATPEKPKIDPEFQAARRAKYREAHKDKPFVVTPSGTYWLFSDDHVDKLIEEEDLANQLVRESVAKQGEIKPVVDTNLYTGVQAFYDAMGSPTYMPMHASQVQANPQIAQQQIQFGLNNPALVATQLAAGLTSPGMFAYGVEAADKLASDEGITKTVRKFGEGDIKGGIKSAAGDILDATMAAVPVFDAYRAVRKAVDPVYNLGHELMRGIDLGIDEIPVINKAHNINLESVTPSTEKLLTLNQADQINQLSRAVNENREFIKAYNEWNKFGYPEVPKGLEYDTDQLNAFVRGQLNRHNTYARGVDLYPQKGYKPALEKKLGRTLTNEEFLRYAATHPMETDVRQPMLWITPSTSLAHGYGDVALVRRPFTLGKNRMNWFNEASFNIESNMRPSVYNDSDVHLINAAENYDEIYAPWTRMGDTPGIERELGAPYEMDFIEWLQNFTHGRHKVSLNNKVRKFNPPLDVEKLRQLEENSLTSHLQGEDAVKMFKEYGGKQAPEGSPLMEQIRLYVPEARERYGLIGNASISDEEIAQSLYKQALELGEGTGAVYPGTNEPIILFRGNTSDVPILRPRKTPSEFVDIDGTMDNSLGTLFLGELPTSSDDIGVYRYLVRGNDFDGKVVTGAGGGNKARPIINNKIISDAPTEGVEGVDVYEFPKGTRPVISYNERHPYTVYKLPWNASSTGYNAVDSYIVRTPNVRDVTNEMKTIMGSPNEFEFTPFKWLVPKENRVGFSERQALAAQYEELLKQAELNNEGLLRSNKNTINRGDEHPTYTYYALPNFNLQGAKHILPYDMRKPRNWNDKNVYRSLIPLTLLGGAAYGASTSSNASDENL